MKLKKTALLIILIFNSISVYATGQIADTFLFKGEKYSLIGKTHGALTHPKQFGMTPVMISTGCYRGYYATYNLTDTNLFLRDLTLREKYEEYLPINDVEPDTESKKYQASYHNLKVEVKFTGKIRLAKDLIRGLRIHMGYQKPTAFKTVLDITLKDGKIVDIKNRSKEMEDKRGKFKKRFESGELKQPIVEAFSLDMKLE